MNVILPFSMWEAPDFPIVTSTLLFTFYPEISVSSLRMSTTKPVLIVGAGPTGMMAAIELNRFDISVRLITWQNQLTNSSLFEDILVLL